eukprot:scaffold133658_cov30-Tisochrysis_lutea.AAC.1
MRVGSDNLENGEAHCSGNLNDACIIGLLIPTLHDNSLRGQVLELVGKLGVREARRAGCLRAIGDGDSDPVGVSNTETSQLKRTGLAHQRAEGEVRAAVRRQYCWPVVARQ